MQRTDCVVVGAGAMGSAAAWTIAGRGRSVVLLEQFEQGHVRGGSHGGSRIFRLGYDSPDYVRLAIEARDLWRRLESEAGVTLLDTTGAIDHGFRTRESTALNGLREAMSRCGVASDVLEADEASQRWSGMRFDGPVVFQADGGRVHADRAVRTLQDEAARRGAGLRFGERVRAIGDDGPVVVETDAGEYEAPVVVVAAGSWAPKLVPGLPQITVTNEMPVHFRAIDKSHVWPSFIHHKPGAMMYGLLTTGEGVKVAEHATGPAVDPDDRSLEPDDAGLARVSSYVAEWFPGLDPEPVTVARCLYDMSPSEDFVLDRRSAVVVATGFSGHGFKFTPAIGRILADLAEGDAQPIARFRL